MQTTVAMELVYPFALALIGLMLVCLAVETYLCRRGDPGRAGPAWPSDGALVRQWWYLYLQVLRGAPRHLLDEFQAVGLELERRRVIRPGVPMTREGSEELARDCDLEKRRRRQP